MTNTEKISPECRAFLLEGTHTAKLASVRADGRPHIAPVWFVLDGDTFVFTTEGSTVKGKNMRRDPRVTICVDDERPPFSFAIIDGIAELIENSSDLLEWTTRLGGRYMGEDQAIEPKGEVGQSQRIGHRAAIARVIELDDAIERDHRAPR